jgi:hypothetical protein
VKKFFKKVAALSLVAFLLAIILLPWQDVRAASRDCDSNALIYCGTLTVNELNTKLANGTGKSYQSAGELQNLFSYYGIRSADFGRLVDGYVTNDNRVIVNNQTVGTNVYTMGRSYMSGSVRQNQFPYPIYLRHPSVSFRSVSISAFVLMNPDNTFAYAILKSCGNIVPGVTYVPPTPQEIPTYRIYGLKWLDVDGDGTRDTEEPTYPGVTFRLTGNGVDRTAVSDSTGYARFSGLLAGTYTLTETVPTGYRATTPTTRTIVASGATGSEFGHQFGNQLIPSPEGSLQIFKFNDINGNKIQDSGEPSISGWKFRVVGPDDKEFELTTDANGYARRDDLEPGLYTVTEILEKDWSATTDMSLHKEVSDGQVTTYVFGNRLYTPPVTPPKGGGDTLPVSGPVAVATMAGSAALFSGSAVAWARSKKRFMKSFRK